MMIPLPLLVLLVLVLHTTCILCDATSGSDCAVIQQANVVSGTSGLSSGGSTATVKFLGKLTTPAQCEAACESNSTVSDPCRSWAFYFPDTPQFEMAGACYGRHDDVWPPKIGIAIKRNHVCTAKSCKHPPLPPFAPPPAPPPSLPSLPPLPQRPPAHVDPDLLPIMYLGGVNNDGNTSSNYSRACRFQVVAIINSYCWNGRTDPRHDRCTNHTREFQYIVDQSKALQKQCRGVLTQMYLNSMMNFWWYTSIFAQFDPAQGGDESLLLHDINGTLVRVTQDGGSPNMTVYDWSQNATREIFMGFVHKAMSSGITSFFLDKAIQEAKNGELCNHICDTLAPAKATAWSVGHRDLLREIASLSTGPTVGNGGHSLLPLMGGAHIDYRGSASEAGIQNLIAAQNQNYTSAIGAGFPFSTAGYAAFLVAYEPGRSFMWTYTLDPKDIWIEEFDHNLGAPVGLATRQDTGVYTRQFTHATVSFDTVTNTGSFQWT
jgi:hypothetical protein